MRCRCGLSYARVCLISEIYWSSYHTCLPLCVWTSRDATKNASTLITEWFRFCGVTFALCLSAVAGGCVVHVWVCDGFEGCYQDWLHSGWWDGAGVSAFVQDLISGSLCLAAWFCLHQCILVLLQLGETIACSWCKGRNTLLATVFLQRSADSLWMQLVSWQRVVASLHHVTEWISRVMPQTSMRYTMYT